LLTYKVKFGVKKSLYNYFYKNASARQSICFYVLKNFKIFIEKSIYTLRNLKLVNNLFFRIRIKFKA